MGVTQVEKAEYKEDLTQVQEVSTNDEKAEYEEDLTWN